MVLKLLELPAQPPAVDVEDYMGLRGRDPKPKVDRNSLPELPAGSRTPIILDEAVRRWEVEKLQSVGFKEGDISIDWLAGDSTLEFTLAEKPNDNTYWSALALLFYGDKRLWFWVKAQHADFVRRVLDSPSHPRHRLYVKLCLHVVADQKKIFMGKSKHSSLLEILETPDLPVRHELVGQITADLYSIFLVVLTHDKPESPTEEADDHDEKGPSAINITDIRARGSQNAPHRFLLFQEDEGLYKAAVSELDEFSDFRFASITLKDTKEGLMGLKTPENLPEDLHDGVRHPWRRLLDNEPAPPALVPKTVIPVPDDERLRQVLWVEFGKEAKTAGPTIEVRSADGTPDAGASGLYRVELEHDYSNAGQQQNFVVTVSPRSQHGAEIGAATATPGEGQSHPSMNFTFNITNNFGTGANVNVIKKGSSPSSPITSKTPKVDDADDESDPGPEPTEFVIDRFYKADKVQRKQVHSFCVKNEIAIPKDVERYNRKDFISNMAPLIEAWMNKQKRARDNERRAWRKRKARFDRQNKEARKKKDGSSGTSGSKAPKIPPTKNKVQKSLNNFGFEVANDSAEHSQEEQDEAETEQQTSDSGEGTGDKRPAAQDPSEDETEGEGPPVKRRKILRLRSRNVG